MRKTSLFAVLIVFLAAGVCLHAAGPEGEADRAYFKIKVIDEQTGRGVPLVELKTVHEVLYYTDSNGIVAFYEPGLMNRKVFFHLRSHGYEYPEDPFGYRGLVLEPKPGGEALVKIKRINVAERLYRITGEGLYRDSVLTGEAVPLRRPVLNGLVLGQDSVLQELYRGRLFWIWGDTNRPAYPLGNFSSSGATSDLPGRGGLDPARGVDLKYFVDESGFSKKMVPLKEEGMIWLSALMTVRDAAGRERLLATFSRMKSLGEKHEHGFVAFNDTTETFERLTTFEPGDPAAPGGHPLHVTLRGEPWLYFSEPFHFGVNLRVRATWEDATRLDSYEILLPPEPAARQGTAGLARWKNSAELRASDPEGWAALREKRLSAEQAAPVYDVETGQPVQPHGGTLYWNGYRRKWVAVFLQAWGTPSFIGEVWYAEADTPAGPWAYARKIVTHDDYSFYNVKHHPYFDQEAGRLIYFEGTYTKTFSGTPVATPRYDYNQIMYRLALDDPRLILPEAVYRVRSAEGGWDLGFGQSLGQRTQWDRVEAVAFFACPPGRVRDGCIPVWKVVERQDGSSHVKLQCTPPSDAAEPFFYALPPDIAQKETPREEAAQEKKAARIVVPLCEYRDPSTGEYHYTVEPGTALKEPSGQVVCCVWRSPRPGVVLEPGAKPATLTAGK